MADDVSLDEDENSCPICLDEFKQPKLLPCRHTFCSSCLDAYFSRSRQISDKISCPFCRSQCDLPKNGVNGLLTNFFVNDKYSKIQPDLCVNCSEPLTLGICLQCQDSAVSTEDAEEDDTRSEASDDCTFNVPLSLLCVQKSSTQTNCKMAIDSSISLPPFSESDDPPAESEISCGIVNALCLTPYNDCLVVVNCKGDIFEINEHGIYSGKLNVAGEGLSLRDIAFRSDGQILLLTMQNVFALQLDNEIIYNFVNFEPYFGNSMAVFHDKRVVIVCFANENMEDGGTMLIISDNGQIMYKVEAGEELPMFRPFDVAINPISGLIYASDPSHGMVYIFLECGTFVDKIDGRVFHRWLRLDSFAFIPCGISCDSKGNVVVCDRGTGNLIHFSPEGNLKGVLILESPSEGREIPWLVQLSNNGTIWVGYKPSCTVRTFSIKQFINRLD